MNGYILFTKNAVSSNGYTPTVPDSVMRAFRLVPGYLTFSSFFTQFCHDSLLGKYKKNRNALVALISSTRARVCRNLWNRSFLLISTLSRRFLLALGSGGMSRFGNYYFMSLRKV